MMKTIFKGAPLALASVLAFASPAIKGRGELTDCLLKDNILVQMSAYTRTPDAYHGLRRAPQIRLHRHPHVRPGIGR